MGDERRLSREETEKIVFQGVLHARVEDYEEAAKIFAEHLPRLASGSDDDKIISASAFSYYGLCVARLYKKYSEGIEYCQISMRVQPTNPEHCENLGKIYLLMRNRRKAVDAFHQGLEREPGNAAITRILNRIGKRREPVIPFLSRDFPVNIWLGRKRHEKFMKRREAIRKAKLARRKQGKVAAADVRLRHAQLRADQHRSQRKEQARAEEQS
jgi:tetratricopeptide (TPR) repeat protein